MIHIEDSSFPLENEFDSLLPFEIYLTDTVEITAYDIVQDIASEFVDKFAADPLSDTALDYLNMKLNPIVNDLGYEFDGKRLYKWNYTYTMSDIKHLNTDVILPNTIKLDADSHYKNLTTIDLDYIENRNMFVTIIDDKIVSYACENPYDGEYEFEIGVETAPDYRGNGYAVSNTAALTKYGLQLNYTVTYNCSRYNIASQHIAEKVGFIGNGKKYYYLCYRK